MTLSLRAVIMWIVVLVLTCGIPVGLAFAAPDDATMAWRVVELVNQERAKAGLLPLKWNDTLAAAASVYAQDMAVRGFFAHNSPEGTTPVQRARQAGYEPYGWGELYVGENLARGFSNPEGAMQGWMASEGHRNNVLRPEYRELGVGVFTAPSGIKLFVQEFGSRPKVLPLFINGDASTTVSSEVNLSLCTEMVSSWGSVGEITGMMVSNSPDFAGAAWEPYRSSKTWTLPSTAGTRNVYVRLRDRSGIVLEASDEILLLGVQGGER